MNSKIRRNFPYLTQGTPSTPNVPGSVALPLVVLVPVLATLLVSPLASGPAWGADPVPVPNLGANLAADPAAVETDFRATLDGPSRYQLSRWLGADGEPLPFDTDAELLDFLETAPVVKKKVLSSGSTQPWKLTLERDGIRANAIFRHVDINENERSIRQFRDWYGFEVAAYEVDRLLGLGHVPPATLRQLEGVEGSIQLWVENARSETDRMDSGDEIEDMGRFRFQKYRMEVFDILISNFDRNTGNQLIDGDGKLWFIDHTRSFRRLPTLDSREVKVCERPLWERLQALDPAEVKKRLSPYLDSTQLKAFEKRWTKLVERLRARIDEKGEAAVIIEVAG